MKRASSFYVNRCCSLNPGRNIIFCIMSFILLVMLSGVNGKVAHAQINADKTASVSIAEGDEWHYFKGIQNPPQGWSQQDFDHSSWAKGPSSFGYSLEGTYGTPLWDMNNTYSTVYARHKFAINNIHNIAGMTLSVTCDGPFAAYLNGIAVIRTNSILKSGSDITYQAEQFISADSMHELFPSENVLAIECSNDDIKSSDFSFIPVFEVLENKEVQQ